jgi:hypothetical protein
MPEYTEKNAFKYLFELQKSGITNMFGAASYMQKKFPELDYEECKDLLLTWMNDWENIHKSVVSK